jgi:hypothetical protein
MKVYLNSITGIDDAIVTMYMSKRSWSRTKEEHLRMVVEQCTFRNGTRNKLANSMYLEEFDKELGKLIKWGTNHFTMLRFIDFSVTVEGLHRGGTDDFDAHAKRLDNRIIRSSTRLASYSTEEISEWYEDKIVPTDVALAYLGITTPDEIKYNGDIFVKGANGYIKKGLENNNDVKRGLYMLSLPMDFIFKVNITEFAHIVKERDGNGNAAPELKIMIENLLKQIEDKYSLFNRELFYKILN